MIRRALVRLIDPQTARDARRWQYASARAHDAYRWLSDEQGALVAAWILQSTAQHFGDSKCVESQFPRTLGNIADFRAWLQEWFRTRRRGLAT